MKQPEKIKVGQVIVVEGKYDKIKLESLVDGLILTTDGFRIFKDKQKRDLIRTLAQKQGVIILTDSDVAGFKIRGLIHSVVRDAPVINLYIPQIPGKEKRKSTPSKEGTLGVEGLDAELLWELFVKHGVMGEREEPARPVTRMDLMEDGLCGGENSAGKRAWVLKELELPPYLSTKALIQVINRLMSYEEYRELVGRLPKD